MLSSSILTLAEQVISECQESRCRIVTAESCTGGLLAAALTSVPGASSAFDRGLIVYAYESKLQMLAVSPATLAAHGAVSEEAVAEMADRALALSYPYANLSIAITGVSGPGSASATKPAGLVFVACAIADPARAITRKFEFGDVGRHAVREHAVQCALHIVLEQLHRGPVPKLLIEAES